MTPDFLVRRPRVGQIGVMTTAGRVGWRIGPPAARERLHRGPAGELGGPVTVESVALVPSNEPEEVLRLP